MPAETTTHSRPANPAHRTERPPTLEEHLRAWGLHHAPFAATAGTSDKPAQLYTTPAGGEIRHLLDTTAALRGVMTLTGSPGAGKSTLIKSWIAGLEPKRFLPQLITQSSLSATGVLETLLSKLEDIAAYLRWHISRAGLEADVFAPAAIDLLAQASEGNPRTLGLLAQAAWLAAARDNQFTIGPEHVHTALRKVPSAKAKIPHA